MVVSAQFIFSLLRKLLTKLILHSCQEVMNKHAILMLQCDYYSQIVSSNAL